MIWEGLSLLHESPLLIFSSDFLPSFLLLFSHLLWEMVSLCCPSQFSLWLSFLTTLSCWVILSALHSPVLFSQHQEHKDSNWGIWSLSRSSAFSSAVPFYLHLELLFIQKCQGILYILDQHRVSWTWICWEMGFHSICVTNKLCDLEWVTKSPGSH